MDDDRNLYERVRVEVECGDGKRQCAFAYICRMDPEKEMGEFITHGDWRLYLQESQKEDAADDWRVKQEAARVN